MAIKMICFDMDGTIADLYAVENWLVKLRTENPSPYIEAAPMWDMEKLRKILLALMAQGIEVRIITWLSMDSTEEYKKAVRQAKMEWLKKNNFPFDKFHCIQYGTTKANCIRKALENNEEAILIDDNKKVRDGWHLGTTIDPTEKNIIEILDRLAQSMV